MFLSIIIPFYNGQDKITKCLDSIYSQGLPEVDFEVIIVDDKSPTQEGEKLIKQYAQLQPNLKYIRHEINTRQGGARNTGVKIAKGEYVAFIDQDDTFREDSWPKVVEALKNKGDLDILMVSAENITSHGNRTFGYEAKNHPGVMTGQEFIASQEIPWVPWCYIYRKDYLLKNNLQFTENTRFEDVDFVLQATVLAKKMNFEPIILAQHWIYTGQTSAVSNNPDLIHDLLYLSHRIGEVSKMEGITPEATKTLKYQYCFHYNMVVTRFLS